MGIMDPKDMEEVIRRKTVNVAGTRPICIEKTHNRAGGRCWRQREYLNSTDG